MYTLQSTCALIIHLLLKHPILAVAMGVVGASIFLTPLVKTPEGYNTEWSVISNQAFTEKVDKIKADPLYTKRQHEAERWFQAVLALDNGKPGITKAALKDLERMINQGEMGKYPDCPIEIPDILRSDNETKVAYARLYFYDQMRRFQNPELAVLAYRYGPTNTAKIVKNYNAGKLPKEQRSYLSNLKKALKDIQLSSIN
ncbi:MAG: hypothetical protein N3A59_00350 [Thermodesulfovibrionales bacterium]|nr:hypothetical protein [Thermodesulfovibrionales bacterium]